MLASKTDADANAVTYTYDASGKLDDRTWARLDNNSNPLTTDYVYNSSTGELTGIDYSDSTADISFAYDRLGRKTSVTDATGSRIFGYTDNLQIDSETQAGLVNRTLTRTYESSGVTGRNTGFSVNGYAIDYGFDQYGRMNTVGWDVNGDTGNSQYAYVNNSDLLASVSVGEDFQTTYTYGPNRNLKTQIQNTFTPQIVSQYDYTYDALGRRTSVVNIGSAFASEEAFNQYAYNDRNELTESERFMGTDPDNITQPVEQEYRAYDFDPIGNINSATEGAESKSYAANSLNQYGEVTAGGETTTLSYDADGNLTVIPVKARIQASGGQMHLSYNAENRLIAFEPATPVDGDTKIEYVYDYMGRRVKKAVYDYNAGSWQLNEEKLFVYDGWNLVEEISIVGADQSSRYFVWGLDLSQSLQGAGGIGGLLATVDGADTYYFAYDGNGNVGQVIEASSGTIAASYQYDPFGNLIKSEGAYADENPYRFSTKYHDDETDLVYYGYRYYLAELGRWINRDPIEEEGGINLYVYVQNNTINNIDYNGLWGTKIHKDATSSWASELGYSAKASEQIGIEDDFVDKGTTSPWPLIGDQSYHFNRNIFGGKDTRLAHFEEHFENAKKSCTSKGNFLTRCDNPEEAARQLGLALHPLQDWVAHGDFGMINSGMIWVPHNYFSPQESLGDRMDRALAVDNPNLDSTGPHGRAAGKAMQYRFAIVGLTDWAYFKPGNERLSLTKEKTQDALREFKEHIRDNYMACRCYYYFLSDIVEVD